MSITLKKSNFSKSKLTATLAIDGLSFVITTGDGAKFPATGVGNIFRAVIWGKNYSTPELDPAREIIECYRNSGDTFTLTAIGKRGMEGTSAKAWVTDDNIALVLTKGVLDEYETEIASKEPAITTLIVSKGGTGAGTFTPNAILLGNGTGAITPLALGTANQIPGMNAGGTAYEHKTISGTSNQVVVTHSAGAITLSLPQNIHSGATPTFAGATFYIDTSNNTYLTIKSGTTKEAGILFYENATVKWEVYKNTSNNFAFYSYVAGTDILILSATSIVSNASISIGRTTGIDRKLSIGADADTYNGVQIYANSVNWTIDNRGSVDTPNNRLAFYYGGTQILNLLSDGTVKFPNTASFSAGAGTPLLGTNCPAVTVSAPHTWLKVIADDGDTVYLPAWK